MDGADEVDEETSTRELVLQDKSKSLWLLSVQNPLRRFMIDKCTNSTFDKRTTFIIVVNCLVLSVYDPINTSGPRNQHGKIGVILFNGVMDGACMIAPSLAPSSSRSNILASPSLFTSS